MNFLKVFGCGLFFVPLCFAMDVKTEFFDAIKTGNIEVVRTHVVKDRSLLEAQSGGKTALVIAIEENQAAMARVLLDEGADVNAQGRLPQSALSAAIGAGNYTMVQSLINDYHADVNTTHSLFCYAPLHLAVRRGCRDTVRFLVEQGAPLDTVNGRGESSLAVAIGKRDYQMVKMLLECGASVIADMTINHLVRAIEEKDHMIVRLVVNRIKQILQESDDQGIISEIRRYLIESFDFIRQPPTRLFARGTVVYFDPRMKIRALISEMRVFEELRELSCFDGELNLPIARMVESLKGREMTKSINFHIQLVESGN